MRKRKPWRSGQRPFVPSGGEDDGYAVAGCDRTSYATLGRRLTAYLLDLGISLSVGIAVVIALRLLMAVGAWMPRGVPGWRAGAVGSPEELWASLGVIRQLAVLSALVLLGGPVYFTLFEASPYQATFGQRLLNIYVTGDDGRPISIARSLGGLLALWILNTLGLSLISLVTIVATKKRKGLHNFLAHTLVLKGRPEPGRALEPWRIVTAFGFPFAWALGTFLAAM